MFFRADVLSLLVYMRGESNEFIISRIAYSMTGASQNGSPFIGGNLVGKGPGRPLPFSFPECGFGDAPPRHACPCDARSSGRGVSLPFRGRFFNFKKHNFIGRTACTGLIYYALRASVASLEDVETDIAPPVQGRNKLGSYRQFFVSSKNPPPESVPLRSP